DGLEYLLLTKNNVVVEHAGRLQEEDFPLSLKRKQAISFSESTARLFGESPEEVARNPEARKMVQ
ncbi:unnamed protein product, partial [Durusdinium trenchii]